MIYGGRVVSNPDLPLSYLPHWFAVATPPLWSILAIAGLIFTIRRPSLRLLLLPFGGFLLLHLGLYLLMRPAIYDGLRHYLFLYPVLALWATLGLLEASWGPFLLRAALVIAVAVQSTALVRHAIRWHPYEYLYFNTPIGGNRGAWGKMEFETYGTALGEAARWLRTHGERRPDGTMRVAALGNPYQSTFYFDDGMEYSSLDRADYFICTTRLMAHESYTGTAVVHRVQREGIPLAVVIRGPVPGPDPFRDGNRTPHRVGP
jgi:hypothetical protein